MEERLTIRKQLVRGRGRWLILSLCAFNAVLNAPWTIQETAGRVQGWPREVARLVGVGYRMNSTLAVVLLTLGGGFVALWAYDRVAGAIHTWRERRRLRTAEDFGSELKSHVGPVIDGLRLEQDKMENIRADVRRDMADADAALMGAQDEFVERHKIKFIDDHDKLPPGRPLTQADLDRMVDETNDNDGGQIMRIRGETRLDYFWIVCEECNKDVTVETLDWDNGVPQIKFNCEECGPSSLKLHLSQWDPGAWPSRDK